MPGSNSFSSIVLDLGDVLFNWSRDAQTGLSPKVLKAILTSPTWFDYERGRLSREECYDRVSEEFKIPTTDIASAFEQAWASLTPNNEMFSLITELKQSNPGLRVFAMSNISAPDWEVLQKRPVDWTIFERVFPSSSVGERKPNLGFYKHVIQATGIDTQRSIFIDDKLENVLSARSLGFYGLQFETCDTFKRALRNLLGDPVARGKAYMSSKAKEHVSVTGRTDRFPETVLHENFAQLLILEATNDPALVHLVEHGRTWNFFHGKGQLTTEAFPFDIDTTSLGLTVTKPDIEIANSVMDEMLQYVDADGIIQTYFDHRRPRFDPVVCVNALTLFYTYGRGAELRETLDWVHEVLRNRAYLDGTRYYITAECFLFCLSRLLEATDDAELHALLMPLLKERIQERIGVEGDAMALAMRIIVCNFVGIRNEIDMRTLLPLQCEDGGWEIGWIYKYGASGLKIGNRGLTTALAVKAVEEFEQHGSRSSSPTTITVPESGPTLKKKGSFSSISRRFASSFSNKIKNVAQRILPNGLLVSLHH